MRNLLLDPTIPPYRCAAWCVDHQDGAPLDQSCHSEDRFLQPGDAPAGEPGTVYLVLDQYAGRHGGVGDWEISPARVVLGLHSVDVGRVDSPLHPIEARAVAAALIELADLAETGRAVR